MTYQIYYTTKEEKNSREYLLFDIEYYLKKVDNSEEWNSEIHCLPIVEGISYFIKESLNNKDFNLNEFIDDATDIQEIRSLLYEQYNNKPKSKSETSNFHYKIFGKILEGMLNDFANKYGLYINRD